MRVLEVGFLRCEYPRAFPGELTGAGHEVRVQVRLGDPGDRESHGLGGPKVRNRIPRGVDGERTIVGHLDQVGGVAEPLVDDR